MNNVNQQFGSSFEEIIAVLMAEPDSQAPAPQYSKIEEEKATARACSEAEERR
jgi:hypothetical protein